MDDLRTVEQDLESHIIAPKGHVRRRIIGNIFFHADQILLHYFNHHELLDDQILELVEQELKEKIMAMDYFTLP